MVDKLKATSSAWWAYLILGILATLLGVFMFCNFGFTFVVVEIMTAIFFLVTGIGGAIITVADRKLISLWGLKLFLEILVAVVGVFILIRPQFAANFIWILCGLGFLFDGIAMIILAINIKKFELGAGWVALLIFGILVVLAAICIFCNPFLGIMVVNFCTAFGVLFYGIESIIFAVQVKKLQ